MIYNQLKTPPPPSPHVTLEGKPGQLVCGPSDSALTNNNHLQETSFSEGCMRKQADWGGGGRGELSSLDAKYAVTSFSTNES